MGLVSGVGCVGAGWVALRPWSLFADCKVDSHFFSDDNFVVFLKLFLVEYWLFSKLLFDYFGIFFRDGRNKADMRFVSVFTS